MKKITAITSAALASLISAAPALADTINPCPNGLGGGSKLCTFSGDKFGAIVSNVITTLVIIAVIIAVFFLVWGGIKWIMSGGDKAKVESARNTIIGGIVGLVLVFLSYFIISVVAQMFGINISTGLSLPNIIP